MSAVDQIAAIEAGLAQLGKHVPELPQPQILAARLLVYLGRQLTAMMDQRLKPHGLGEMEFRTLMNVYVQTRFDHVTNPGALCSSLGQSPANITRLTESLVQRGLISRQPDLQDRRKLGLRTTPAGDQLVNTLLPIMQQSARDNFRSISQQDLDALIDLLKRLAAVVDSHAVTSTETESST